MSNLNLYTFFQKLANAPAPTVQTTAGGSDSAQAPATPDWQHSIGNLGKRFMELMRANPQYAGSIFGALLGRSIMNSVSDRGGGGFGHLGMLGGGALGYLAGHSLKVPDVEQTQKNQQRAVAAARDKIKSEGEVNVASGLFGAAGGGALGTAAAGALDVAADKGKLGTFMNRAVNTPGAKGGRTTSLAQVAMILGGMGYGAYHGFKPKQVVPTTGPQ